MNFRIRRRPIKEALTSLRNTNLESFSFSEGWRQEMENFRSDSDGVQLAKLKAHLTLILNDAGDFIINRWDSWTSAAYLIGSADLVTVVVIFD